MSKKTFIKSIAPLVIIAAIVAIVKGFATGTLKNPLKN